MSRSVLLLFTVSLATVCLPRSITAQTAVTPPSSTASPQATEQAAQAPLTIKTYSRMVALEVVVEDSKGRHITGLNAEDFKIFEQTPRKSGDKREQKIAAIREVHTAALKPPAALPATAEPGVYTNAIDAQLDTVPPTVLVVDGINTPIQAQAQVHEQMLKILRQLPPNVPVAVMLMGNRLEMLQGFTTDPKLLQQALAKAHSVVGQGLQIDPRWDPDAPMNLAFGLQGDTSSYSASLVNKIGGFHEGIYAWTSPLLLRMTCDAFMSIAHSLEGYPGRKNLLWLSTSFPLTDYLAWSPGKSAHPNIDDNLGIPNYIQILDNALSDARIAIYPVDLGGVTTLQAFTAQTRVGAQSGINGTIGAANAISSANQAQLQQQFGQRTTMDDLASATGGKVCAGDNDLGDCVRKAVDDGSDFYEISYYPDSPDWNGEYRKIVIEPRQRSAHLSYRQGYYATPEGSPDPHLQAEQMQDHCNDMLNATAIAFSAKEIPASSFGQTTFSIDIDSAALTFAPAPDGSPALNLEIGFCTYDRKGVAQKLTANPLDLKLDAKSYHTLASGGRLHYDLLVPSPQPAAVRLLVKDVASGRLGSIYIKTGDLVAAVPKPAEDPHAVFQ